MINTTGINGDIPIIGTDKTLKDLLKIENVGFNPQTGVTIEFNNSKNFNNTTIINLRLSKTNIVSGYNLYGIVNKYTPKNLVLFNYLNEGGGTNFCYIDEGGYLFVNISDISKKIACINIVY